MIIVDVEASGIDPQKNSLLSIGAVDFENPERIFYEECRIWDGAQISDEALLVNGFSREEIVDKNKKTEADIVISFLHWVEQVKEHTLAGQNPSFDLGFIHFACLRNKINFTLAYRTIDLHSVCFAHMMARKIEPLVEKGRSGIDSDFIMKYVGIPAEPKPHIALNGAIWETEAFGRLLKNEILLEKFKDYVIPWLA